MMIRAALRHHWKLVVNILTIIALIALAVAIRGQLVLTFHNLFKVNVWLILLFIPIQVVSFHAQAKVYQGLLAMFGEAIPYRRLLGIATELNFVNHVFPSGGVSGISYFGFRVRGSGVRAGRATLVQTVKFILLFVSYEPLLFAGLLLLALSGRASNMVILIASVLTMLVLFGTLALVYIVGSIARIRSFVTGLTLVVNRLIQLLRPDHPETLNMDKVQNMLEEYHQDFLELRSRMGELYAPLWWSAIMNLMDVLAVYTVYLAFGETVNLGAVIIAYAVANFAGLVSVLPGGVGIYEGLMTFTLVAAGVPARLSLPVTVMYRVVDTVFQLAPGFVLYQRTLHRQPQDAAEL